MTNDAIHCTIHARFTRRHTTRQQDESSPERPVPYRQRYYLAVFNMCELLLESFPIQFAQTTHCKDTHKRIVYAQDVIFMTLYETHTCTHLLL